MWCCYGPWYENDNPTGISKTDCLHLLKFCKSKTGWKTALCNQRNLKQKKVKKNEMCLNLLVMTFVFKHGCLLLGKSLLVIFLLTKQIHKDEKGNGWWSHLILEVKEKLWRSLNEPRNSCSAKMAYFGVRCSDDGIKGDFFFLFGLVQHWILIKATDQSWFKKKYIYLVRSKYNTNEIGSTVQLTVERINQVASSWHCTMFMYPWQITHSSHTPIITFWKN